MKSSLFTKTRISDGFNGLRAAGLLVILLVVQLNAFSQSTIYIDPSNTASNQNGTIANPYSSWDMVSLTNGNTYLQKRGTTFNTAGGIFLTGKNNITLGAYGTGSKPKIISSSSSARILRLTNSSYCTIRDLEVTSTTGILGPIALGIDGSSGYNTIDSCLFYNCEYGINMNVNIGTSGNQILNTVIHTTGDDGFFAKNMLDLEVGHCHIYDVNNKYLINPDQSYSAGDCIQIVGYPNQSYALSINIHDNILDHSSMGNKFCLIVVGDYYSGVVEGNTMTGSSSTSCMYLWHTTGTMNIRKNTLQSAVYGIYSYVHDLQVQYNKIINNTLGISVLPSSLTQTTLTALNNVFYNNSTSAVAMNTASNPSAFISKNNTFYLLSSSSKAYITSNSQVTSNYNDFNVQQSGFINSYGTLASWQSASGNDINSFVANPSFVNPSSGDFCLLPNSPCINTGGNVGLTSDFFGTPVPQSSGPDIGIHEVISSGGNQPPVIGNQTFSVAENSVNGTIVGQVVASDPDAGQSISYSISGGNSSNAFSISSTSGILSVANSAALNFETTPVFQLTVQVQDNGSGNLTASALVTVNLLNVNENPVISNQTFNVSSNSANGTVVGTVVATDPDNNQTLAYSITAGNTSSAFALNASTGVLTVANSAAVNYLINPVFSLTVRVQDNGSPVLSAYATVTVNVTAVNNAPVITNQTFTVNENSPQGTQVGQVAASDPDPGQSLVYSILSGNTGSTFQISSSGMISVANNQLLNYENQTTFQLQVQVTDNGVPPLSSSTNITISVLNVNEAPVVASNQSFSVAELSAAGTQAGTVSASDPDNGQTLTFSITGGNTNNAFSIAPSTGIISVAGTLNFEALNTYNLTVRATDNGSPVLYDQKVVVVHVTDVNENPVVGNQSFEVASYSASGTLVGTVVASDPDLNQTLSYSIVSGNTSNAFAINPTSGSITVSNSSAVNYLVNPVFSLNVKVQDNGSPVLASYATVTITVTPVNTSPTISNQSFSTNENMPAGVIVGHVIAVDPDAGQTLSYAITSGNTDGAFQIGANGVLSISNSAAIDFETNPVFQLSVTVTDNGQPQLSATALVTVSLNDVNESPEMTGNANFAINEHVPQGTPVGVITATDPDAGQTLSYSIVAGNTNNAFAISASSGEITVNGTICYENCSQYHLTVRATDNGSPVRFSEEISNILLNDVNELPIIENQAFSVSAFASNGTIVGTVLAEDPDMNQELAYTISAGNTSGAFALSASTGELTVANSAALNPATNPVFALTVTVQDNGTPALSSSATITISLNSENSAPVIESQAFTIDENVPAGTVVGQIIAGDPNQGQTLAYSILSGNNGNAFEVSPDGILRVQNPDVIDYETNPLFTLLVMVSDNGSPVLWAQAPVSITVRNQNDPPVLLPQTFTAKENIPNGRYVCRVIATDQDPGDTYQSYIMGGNTDNAFKMQAYTSRIFVNNSAALNFEENPVFYLTVRSVDNHGAYSEQIITIQLIDVNEAPVVLNQTFSVSQNASNGTFIGQVEATDPDAGQTLKYSITQGNTSGIFSIGLYSGELTVANAAALHSSTASSFQLTVKVRDNGSPVLTSNGYMTITVIRSKESGELIAEALPDRLNLELTVYPNPSPDGFFNIKLKEDTTEETTLIITDLTGKKVGEERFSGVTDYRINLSDLPSGMYLMHAQNAQRTAVVKLIKQ